MRGRGLLFGLEGALFELCLMSGNEVGCFSVEGDVAGDIKWAFRGIFRFCFL